MQTVYDDFPYPGASFAQTHPDRLATVGTLFGLSPAPSTTCRVLELGCGDGGNLVPIAYSLPGARCTGVDLSGAAIARAQSLIEQLALTNIRVRQLDLMDLAPDFGEYDYIIAHGLYSWVPPPVRERVLAICRAHLAPNGIAYISYNAYPGGHLRDAVRNMMRFHTRHIASPAEQVQQARELLEFLVHTQTEDGAFGLFLRSELQSILDRSPAALFHDELAEHNHRFYLHEFLADASRYGLRYFSEARLSSFQAETLPAEVMDRIATLAHGDDREYDQYLDFLNAKIFRQNLLCRAELQPLRRVDTAQVIKMWASSDAQPASGHPDVGSTASEEFQLPDGGKISSNHPITKAALLHLGSVWPKAVAVSELLRIARGLAGRHTEADAADDAAWLLQSLVKLYAAKFLELHMRPRSFTAEVSERPVASPLARAQIRMDAPVSNLACSSVALDDPLVRALMLLLDGTRDRGQILSELRVLAGPVEITAEQLEVNLNRLARLAFLTA